MGINYKQLLLLTSSDKYYELYRHKSYIAHQLYSLGFHIREYDHTWLDREDLSIDNCDSKVLYVETKLQSDVEENPYLRMAINALKGRALSNKIPSNEVLDFVKATYSIPLKNETASIEAFIQELSRNEVIKLSLDFNEDDYYEELISRTVNDSLIIKTQEILSSEGRTYLSIYSPTMIERWRSIFVIAEEFIDDVRSNIECGYYGSDPSCSGIDYDFERKRLLFFQNLLFPIYFFVPELFEKTNFKQLNTDIFTLNVIGIATYCFPITTIFYDFLWGCRGAKKLVIPKIFEEMNASFECLDIFKILDEIEEVVFEGLPINYGDVLYHMSHYCQNVKRIFIKSSNDICLSSLHWFEKLEYLKLPQKSVISYGCFSGLPLKKVIFTKSKKAGSIGEYAFSGCTALETVKNVWAKFIGDDCFSDCSNLVEVTGVYEPLMTNEDIYKSLFKGCFNLVRMNLLIRDTGVKQHDFVNEYDNEYVDERFSISEMCDYLGIKEDDYDEYW